MDEQIDRPLLLLNVLHTTYQYLLARIDDFDRALRPRREWNAYQLVSKCINRGGEAFSSSLPSTSVLSDLYADLLDRIGGYLAGELSASSPVIHLFRACREDILSSVTDPSVDYSQDQRIGESLSRNCYCQGIEASNPNLLRSAELILRPSNQARFYSIPSKNGGASKICFEYSLRQFGFESSVNLPFYFFHEYFSHIHSAEMFGEHHTEADKAFEDGWMMFAASMFYREQLTNAPDFLSHSGHRKHYAEKYVIQARENFRFVNAGYELAYRFHDLADRGLFWNLTLQLALARYDLLEGILDLHGEFLVRLESWLWRVERLPKQKRLEAVNLLIAATEALDSPLMRLFDVIAN